MKNQQSPYEYLWRREHKSGRFPVLKYDPDVRGFAETCLKGMNFEQTANACKKKFGVPRAPSSSAIHRHWQKNKERLLALWAS
jgi:hypothetical protein